MIKKIPLFVIAILLIFTFLLSGCTTSSKYTDEAPTSRAAPISSTIADNPEPETTPSQETPSDEPKTHSFNEPVIVDNFKYTFKSQALAKELGRYVGDYFSGTKANGIYFIVELEVENIGSKAEYLSSSNIKVIDDQKREFETDSSAQIYLSMAPGYKDAKSMIFDKLNPGLTQQGYVVFDVPEDISGVIQVVDNSIFPSEVAWVSWD